MSNKLHIVSFNVPYPADYGGVIDVYNRLVALHRLGVDIHLHTFTYGRPESKELEQCCTTVTYYRRHTGLASAMGPKPYIVKSRQNNELLHNLQSDNAPILLEGLHCCSVLEQLEGRRILVRAHNVEHEYYARLAAAERNIFRRLYLRSEARRLLRYEPILLKSNAVLAVTQSDAEHFKAIGCQNVLLMPSSHNDDEVISLPNSDNDVSPRYVLYHADLSVPENIETVEYLCNNIFGRCPDIHFVVAGRNPSKRVTDSLASHRNVSLVANPDDDSMRRLIQDAQVLMLFTNFPTGLKLKLLNSLYAGRHCLVNSAMVAGTELGRLCTVADTVEQQLQSLKTLIRQPFTKDNVDQRRTLLGSLYSNEANARILLSQI